MNQQSWKQVSKLFKAEGELSVLNSIAEAKLKPLQFSSFKRIIFLDAEPRHEYGHQTELNLQELLKNLSNFYNKGEIVGSVPKPNSLLGDLNIKSPKCKQAELCSACVMLKTLQLQLFSESSSSSPSESEEIDSAQTEAVLSE
ncbi:hypothetical protein Tco_0073111 [Tanacetum coccineum]